MEAQASWSSGLAPARLLVLFAGLLLLTNAEHHALMSDEEFHKLTTDRKYILDNNEIVIFLCDASDQETKTFEERLEIFGESKNRVKIVDTKTKPEYAKFAQNFGIGTEAGERCPGAVYLPRWLSVPESISTKSHEVTFDMELSNEHLIQWIWHHMDIKGFTVFKSHLNATVEVFWKDPIHKREWPSFSLKPHTTEKRNVILGHVFFLRKKYKNHILEAAYTVRTSEAFVDVLEEKIKWSEAWSTDPDHLEKTELTGKLDIDKKSHLDFRQGSAPFHKRGRRLYGFRYHGNPALIFQAFIGSVVGVMMMIMLVLSTILRFIRLLREGVRGPIPRRRFASDEIFYRGQTFLKSHRG